MALTEWRRKVDMPAQRALARLGLPGETVEMVPQESLPRRHVDLALVLLHQRQPAGVPRVLAVALIVRVEVRFFLDQLGVVGKIRAHEKAVLGARENGIL